MHNKISVAAGINTFNDRDGLARTLSSILPYVDKAYVVDGKYPDYQDGSGEERKFSTDGTRELVSQYDNCVYIPMVADQIGKRTRYLRECECDFLLVIDADEYLSECNWSVFQDWLENNVMLALEQNRCLAYQVKYESEPGKFIHLARLIYQPNHLYYYNHWTLMPTQGYRHGQPYPSSMVAAGLTMATDDLLRPASRLQQDIEYQWLLFRKEGVISEQEYRDVERKRKFAEHIIHEVEVWKK